jgi:hypothetical protein
MPTMTGCPEVRILEQLLLGQVPAAEAEALALHVAAGSRCDEALQQIRADDPLVDAMRHLPAINDQEQNQLVQVLIPCLKRLQPNEAQRTLPHEAQHHEPAEPTPTAAAPSREGLRPQRQRLEQQPALAPRRQGHRLGKHI